MLRGKASTNLGKFVLVQSNKKLGWIFPKEAPTLQSSYTIQLSFLFGWIFWAYLYSTCNFRSVDICFLVLFQQNQSTGNSKSGRGKTNSFSVASSYSLYIWRKYFNFILDALFMTFVQATSQFILEDQKDLKNVHTYALLKLSTGILVKP